MQEYTIFDIRIRDYTEMEALHLLGKFLNNGGLNTVSYLNTEMLVDSEKDEQCQAWINDLDMTIVSEAEIIKATGRAEYSRLQEIEDANLPQKLIQQITTQGLTVYLITDSNTGMMELERELRQLQPSMKVGGRFVLASDMFASAREDVMINDINDIAPTVIISRLPFREQLRLMADNKKRINGELWLGLLNNISLQGTQRRRRGLFSSLFYRILFARRVSKYHHD